ncbi:MAG: ABC transporter ATP-binding protein [Clostridia bacterium]|nr:ABC transporter ATP-binding protein [Clostridia bacterium]
MITLDRVSFAYDQTPVVSDLSLTVSPDRVTCLFGASGCGKSTVLRLIAGLETPQAGTVTRPPDARITMVFQDNRLLPWFTVRQNLTLVAPDADIDAALSAVALQDDAERYPDELSGGMQRRVALARAFAHGGDILLLDEPFNGLDQALKEQIAAYILREFAGKPIVLVTHSPEEAALFDAEIIRV